MDCLESKLQEEETKLDEKENHIKDLVNEKMKLMQEIENFQTSSENSSQRSQSSVQMVMKVNTDQIRDELKRKKTEINQLKADLSKKADTIKALKVERNSWKEQEMDRMKKKMGEKQQDFEKQIKKMQRVITEEKQKFQNQKVTKGRKSTLKKSPNSQRGHTRERSLDGIPLALVRTRTFMNRKVDKTIVKEGILSKRIQKKDEPEKWKEYRFVLRENSSMLKYYIADRLLNSIQLEGALLDYRSRSSKSKQYTFAISPATKKNRIILAAESQEMKDGWLDTLSKFVKFKKDNESLLENYLLYSKIESGQDLSIEITQSKPSLYFKYIVLVEDHIQVYKKAKDNAKIASIDFLVGAKTEKVHENFFKYAFAIQDIDKTWRYLLKAKSEREMETWKNQIDDLLLNFNFTARTHRNTLSLPNKFTHQLSSNKLANIRENSSGSIKVALLFTRFGRVINVEIGKNETIKDLKNKASALIINNFALATNEWVSQQDSCFWCDTSFSIRRRKTCCKICGQYVCYSCAVNKVVVDIPTLRDSRRISIHNSNTLRAGLPKVRVCDTCFHSKKSTRINRSSRTSFQQVLAVDKESMRRALKHLYDCISRKSKLEISLSWKGQPLNDDDTISLCCIRNRTIITADVTPSEEKGKRRRGRSTISRYDVPDDLVNQLLAEDCTVRKRREHTISQILINDNNPSKNKESTEITMGKFGPLEQMWGNKLKANWKKRCCEVKPYSAVLTYYSYKATASKSKEKEQKDENKYSSLIMLKVLPLDGAIIEAIPEETYEKKKIYIFSRSKEFRSHYHIWC